MNIQRASGRVDSRLRGNDNNVRGSPNNPRLSPDSTNSQVPTLAADG